MFGKHFSASERGLVGDRCARKSLVKVPGLQCWGVLRENLGKAQEWLPRPQMLVDLSKFLPDSSGGPGLTQES